MTIAQYKKAYEKIQKDYSTFQEAYLTLEQDTSKLKEKNARLKEQFQQLMRLVNGFKSEKFVSETPPENQLSLFGEASASETVSSSPKETITYTRTKKKHQGRNQLPEHLPVKKIIIEPEEDTSGLKKIGEEVKETLEYTPASLIKRLTIRPKYAKRDQQGVVIAALPTRPISKAIAEASLLAHIIVSKYVDHLPLYRQCQQFKRDFNWELPSSTIGDWLGGCAQLLEPLYNVLKRKILESHYIQADESPIKVLESEKKGSTHKGYQWVYYDPVNALVIFNYRKGRGQHGPKEFLMGYSGYLKCDGYKVYDKLGQYPDITLAGCLVHARRKFHEALDSDKQRAEKALGLFGAIYKKEKQIKQATDDIEKIKLQREKKIKPIVAQIRQWIEAEQFEVLPKSLIGKAMSYYVNQYPKFLAIFKDGRIQLDNNLIENKIRPMALGRKNYLFAGSHKAAQQTAMFYSLYGMLQNARYKPEGLAQGNSGKNP